MKSSELPAIQSSIKQKYKTHPEAAKLTLGVQAQFAEGLCCTLQLGNVHVLAGLHSAIGGKIDAVCPGDIFLGSLVACVAVTLQAVAANIGLTIRGGVVRAEGELDLRGTLGVSEDVLIGFQCVRVAVDLDAEASDDEINKLIALTEKYAVVYQTQVSPPRIALSWNRRVA
jgi:uncharacterized OsmC-like protein